MAAALRWYLGDPIQSITPVHPGWSAHPWLCAALRSLGCGISQVPDALPHFCGWRCPFHGMVHCWGEGKRNCFTNPTRGLRALSWDAENKVDSRGEAKHPTSCRNGHAPAPPWRRWPDHVGPYGQEKLETSHLRVAISALGGSGKPGP